MKAVWMGIIAASALLLVGTAQASPDLAKSSGCMTCHTVDKKLVGPGFKDVAAKYKGDSGAAASLFGNVKNGSAAGKLRWGTIAMPPRGGNINLSDGDIKTLVTWILSLK